MFVKEFSRKGQEEQKRRNELMLGCTRFLSGHGHQAAGRVFAELADYCAKSGAEPDNYGTGEFINSFEEQIAEMLGMEAAVFLPSGVMAQNTALRIWSDHAGVPHVAFHPTSHMEVNEQRAYAHLHNLNVTLLGDKHAPTTAQDIQKCSERIAALLIELPLRRCGGILPTWEELEAVKVAARERGIKLHLDGARLWESQPFYGRPLKAICQGFDSVYVSFYKGIGGLAGSILAGSADFISEARVWQRRHGGNLVQMHPYVVSAKINLERRIDKFGEYLKRAQSCAKALGELDGLTLKPSLPQTPMMHVYLAREVSQIVAARDRIAQDDRFWMGGLFFQSEIPGWTQMEIAVGDAMLNLTNDEIVAAFKKLLA